jgi:hypothetical protein
MKIKAVLLLSLLLTPLPAFASHKRVYVEEICYKNVEEYVSGYYNRYGQYVGGYVKTDRRRVSCRNNSYYQSRSPRYEERRLRCSAARSTLGGLLGGGIAASVSKKDAYGWSIPLGAVLGMGAAQAGCD